MAGVSLLALIDDIATVLDDMALLTKAATKKTAGVLGDDLALNAQQVTGVNPARELPVVWAVAVGSLKNKAILVPAALLISWLMPWLIIPLLMLGGAFLCYEGFEKVAHRVLHRDRNDGHKEALREAVRNPDIDLKALEKDKIRGAIRTDFILSAEIIAITLGTIAGAAFGMQVVVLSVVAVMVTVFVYGLVAGIVKLDDLGLYLSKTSNSNAQTLGQGLLSLAPYLMKGLSILGTIAMFLVGGGIISHGVGPLHHLIERLAGAFDGIVAGLVSMALDGVVGLVAGAVLVLVLTPLIAWWQRYRAG
ncbi:DUF808 domain-containing protein [Marinobacter persicus]|jgi:hypothetical protein|uniref:Inner membrane protein YedI n=1 Tax=Marinobacter persicus TaxID=930118 RepID=A0A2S6GAV5_9GAMM|nr:DUF808 domain-containing protein [Marinobacter persicus]PPK53639.1 hypothetical protein BY455_101152 [Marinobacter persicus]PPK56453.1 hypothetical protein B0H24_1001152 [Marinobacter persicus]PPK60026.1 hypothetical protein BY454_101152 [Marinobacter persicus]